MRRGQQFGLHEALADVVASQPAAVAVSQHGTDLSYLDLDRRAAALALALAKAGVGAGDLVPLISNRSADAIVAMVAIMRLGAAYAPLDPSNPPERMRFLLEDCGANIVLTQAAFLERARAAGATESWVLEECARLSAADGPMVAVGPNDAAYMIYTSGTSGRPKGVLCTHVGIRTLVGEGTVFVDLKGATALHLIAPFFDPSLKVVFGALLNHGRLIIEPEAVPSLDQIEAGIGQGAAWAIFPTGVFHLLVDHRPDALRTMRLAFVGGDVLSPAHAARALKANPRLRLINGYGPTESAVATAMFDLGAENWSGGPIPIGRPVPGTDVFILNEAQGLAGEGEVGEIAVAGKGLAIGYWRRPDLTAEKFPILDATGGRRVYLTGDLGRMREDGAIEFHGRADRQVKIAGKRVELDEIEAILREDEAVADASVILHEDHSGVQRLVAYLTLALEAGEMSERNRIAEAIAVRARGKVQPHMVPAIFMIMDAFPLTSSGKVDRRALPPPRIGSEPRQAVAATRIEEILIEIWKRTLGLEHVGVEENFFDLGGTSMMLVRAHAEIQALIAPDLPLAALLERPRIAEIAAYLRGEAGGDDQREEARRRAAQKRAAAARPRRDVKS